jgi:DHA3 family macrolide efflux protein-like MFS transporter
VFHLLKKRGVLFLGLSSAVSQLGDRLTYMVIITLIGIVSPGNIFAFSEFAIAFTLPIIMLSPLAGVVLDHSNKQIIMFRCHLIQSFLIFLTPTFIVLTHSTAPIWVLVVLFYSLEVFNNTSKNSIIPDLVEYGDLVPANSIITTLARIATFIGMVGGGVLIARVGWRFGFYIDATTHLIAGSLALGMGARVLFDPVKKLEFSITKQVGKSLNLFLNDLKELGILLLKDRMVIFVMISVFILPFVAAIAHTVLVFLVQQEFGLGTAGVGWLGGVIGGGMLAGGVLMGFFGKKISRAKVIIGSVIILSILFLIGPFFITPIFLYITAFISGMMFSFIGIAQDTILQEDVMKEIRGRIFATKEFFINVAFLTSAVLVGIISGVLATYTIIHFIGIMLLVILVFAIFIYRSIPYEIRSKL